MTMAIAILQYSAGLLPVIAGNGVMLNNLADGAT